ERAEAVLAMIGAIAALADAAERLRLLREMRQASIDGHAACHRAAQHAVPVRRTVAEPVQREWTSALVNVADCVVDRVVADDRKQRAEDFLVHDRSRVASIEDQ